VISPDSGETVLKYPTFIWHAFEADFPVGYQASVINLSEGIETAVWTSALLSDTVLSLKEPDSIPLPNGDYYWTITVQDSFENTSRSKEGTFTVFDTTETANRP